MTGRITSSAVILAAVIGITLLWAQTGAGQTKAPLPTTDLPFSQTVTAGGMIFVSGQIGKDPATGKLAGDNIADQTRQALLNIDRHLKAAGSELTEVVRTTVFLKNIEDYGAMNAMYKEILGANRPARSTVAVADLVGGALIEIDAIAVKGRMMGEKSRNK